MPWGLGRSSFFFSLNKPYAITKARLNSRNRFISRFVDILYGNLSGGAMCCMGC